MTTYFNLVFRNKYIVTEIFKKVHEIQQNDNSLHYEEIKDVIWMIKYNHYGLLREKIRNNELLYLNNKSPNYIVTFTSIKYTDLFIILYERFKPILLSMDYFINQCKAANRVDLITVLGERGHLLLHGPSPTFVPENPDILKVLVANKNFNFGEIDTFRMGHTAESLAIVMQNVKLPLTQSDADKLWVLLIKSGRPNVFKEVAQLLKPFKCSFPFRKTNYVQIKDMDLFIHIWETSTHLDIHQKRSWVMEKIITDPNSVSLLSYLRNRKDPVIEYMEDCIDFVIENCIKEQSKVTLNYILDEWLPNHTLEELDLGLDMYNRSFESGFYSKRFVEKLLDRGLDLFKYWISCCVDHGAEDIFYMLWERYSDRIRVRGSKIYLKEKKFTEQDITSIILERCFFISNIQVMAFLFDKGLNLDHGTYSLAFSHLGLQNPKVSMEFIQFLEKSYPSIGPISCVHLVKSLFNLNQKFDKLFEYGIDMIIRNGDKTPENESDFLGKCILTRNLYRLKYLHSKGFVLRQEGELNLESLLAATSISILEFLVNRYDFIKSLLVKVSFISNVVLVNNYSLFKYSLSKGDGSFVFCPNIEVQIAQSNCVPLVDFIIKHIRIDSGTIQQLAKTNNNTLLLEYFQNQK
ncbi:hypothetical protein CYY_008786 [Polysphondylium violaceum]|uniref:Uncharacterized protein n=1 Tax=Polysphondylium violaceum TaxID=133409 RepID=A0A8J4UWN7_9MYCE|nr:hypothetical protein CYY_008786 [Polysphondylium violaceum]